MKVVEDTSSDPEHGGDLDGDHNVEDLLGIMGLADSL